MKTKLSSILLIIFATIIATAGQYFYKIGALKLKMNFISIINYYVFLGFFLYGVAALLMIYSLKGERLSVVHPFIALTYIWVAIVSYFILKENLLLTNWLGIFFIFIGMSLVGYGAEHD